MTDEIRSHYAGRQSSDLSTVCAQPKWSKPRRGASIWKTYPKPAPIVGPGPSQRRPGHGWRLSGVGQLVQRALRIGSPVRKPECPMPFFPLKSGADARKMQATHLGELLRECSKRHVEISFKNRFLCVGIGALGRIRTPDPLILSQKPTVTHTSTCPNNNCFFSVS